MKDTEEWLEPITIGEIFTGDGMQHDGFFDIYIGTELSSHAMTQLRTLLPGKRPAIHEEFVCYGTHIRFSTKPKRGGVKRSEDELKKVARGIVTEIRKWQKSHAIGDVSVFLARELTEEVRKSVQAISSDSHADGY